MPARVARPGFLDPLGSRSVIQQRDTVVLSFYTSRQIHHRTLVTQIVFWLTGIEDLNSLFCCCNTQSGIRSWNPQFFLELHQVARFLGTISLCQQREENVSGAELPCQGLIQLSLKISRARTINHWESGPG